MHSQATSSAFQPAHLPYISVVMPFRSSAALPVGGDTLLDRAVVNCSEDILIRHLCYSRFTSDTERYYLNFPPCPPPPPPPQPRTIVIAFSNINN